MTDLEKVQKTLSETFDYLKGNNLQLIGEDLQTKVGEAHRIVENLIIQRVSQQSEQLPIWLSSEAYDCANKNDFKEFHEWWITTNW